MIGRTALLTTIVAGSVTGVALGTTLLTGGQRPETADESPPELSPRPGTGTIEASAPDPGGRQGWAIKVSRSETDGVCFTVGRTSGGRLGTVDRRGRFTARGESPAESCSPADSWDESPALVAAAVEDGVIVVHGVAGPDVERVTVGDEEVALSKRRAFVAAFAGGLQDVPEHPVTAHVADGTRMVYPFDRAPYRSG